MDLHRTRDRGEWSYVKPEDQNRWQKIADRTDGIATPGNAISLVGAIAVGSGLFDISNGHTSKGVFKIGLGRYADILDGKVAAKTGTKSPIGEGVDAAIDKIELGAALPVMLNNKIINKTTFGSILAPNVANVGLSMVAKYRKINVHPSKAGKIATFGQWFAIGFYSLAVVSKNHNADNLAKRFEIAGNASLILATGLGIIALAGYAKDTLKPIAERPEA